jgi:hypothetical protein
VKTLWSGIGLGLGLGLGLWLWLCLWLGLGLGLVSGLKPSDGMGGVEDVAIGPPACPQEP